MERIIIIIKDGRKEKKETDGYGHGFGSYQLMFAIHLFFVI